MPLDEDKYPEESGRRRFVKGVVGGAALSGLASGGVFSIDIATSSAGAGGGITQYVGIENTDGPAPRGMPIVPVEIESDGTITGVWPEVKQQQGPSGRTITVAETEDFKGTGITYSSQWFQYCGVQTYAGVQPDAEQDNTFRSTPGTYEWQSDLDNGAPLTIEDFDDYETWENGIGDAGLGKPAIAQWRSEGDNVQTMPVQVLRSREVSRLANGEGPYADLDQTAREFVDAATEQNVMAWLDKCTHFCCVPGFKAFGDSAKFDAENEVYCQCHQSVYDPFSPVQRTFTALPRPDE